MKPADNTPAADCGIIVGRFQVHKLHKGHKQLVQHVADHHPKVIIFLGLSKALVTRNNPLDYPARRQMLQREYPDIDVQYIHDVPCDSLWSKTLDERIGEITPTNSVLLYGCRESFIDHYDGRHPTQVMEQESYDSGTDLRKSVSVRTKGSDDFRQGVIWAAYNQYPKVYPTVDLAIWDEDGDPVRLLLARKPNEDLHRFVGGFAEAGESYEESAVREGAEETTLELSRPMYVGSCPVDDWRYRRELDGIVTVLFECKRVFGKPTPRDDICELKWFDPAKLEEGQVVAEHRPLLRMLAARHPDRFKKIEA